MSENNNQISDKVKVTTSERPRDREKVKHRTMLAIPFTGDVYGEVFGPHVATIVETMRLHNDDSFYTTFPRNAYPHDKARQFCADATAQAKCDRLLFIDMDTVIPRGAIAAMYDVMEKTGAIVVSGYYLQRGYPYTPVWSVKREDGRFYQIDALPGSGVVPIDMTGFGCCLIDFGWVQKNVSPPWFKMKQNDLYTDITDDAVFYEKVIAAGGKIVGIPDIQCGHYGDRELCVRESADHLRSNYLHKEMMLKLQIEEMNKIHSVGILTPCGMEGEKK